jgi:diketogulonate reductase-like aldo/keto reductase
MFGRSGNTDRDACVRIIHRALDSGINSIDTADVYSYSESEEIVGEALKGRRGLSVAGERVVLVDGRVAATWRVDAGTVAVTPLRRLSSADRAAVAEEGRELAGFLSDGESHRVRVAV